MDISKAGTFKIGGDLPICRMGYGAMQLTGPGYWGPPADEANARAVLRRAVELGINFIDTADVYGPDHNERIIAEALHPYPEGVVVATKAGLVRRGPAGPNALPLEMAGHDQHIRKAVEGSLRKLKVDCIDLYQLHRIDPATPIEESMEVFRALRDEGKIRHIGLSEARVEDIERARKVVEIATVQNRFNLAHRKYENVLRYCESHGIGFIPWAPLNSGTVVPSGPLAQIIERTGARAGQVALAWLLRKSPVIILIPGTSSVSHLEQNAAACEIDLTDDDIAALDASVAAPATS